MELSNEQVQKVLDENKKLRKLVADFQEYDKKRKAYYDKVQEDLEEYSARYLALKKTMEISEGDDPVTVKYKKLQAANSALNSAYDRLRKTLKLIKDDSAMAKAEEMLKRYDELRAAQAFQKKEDKMKKLKEENKRLLHSISNLIYKICRMRDQLEQNSSASSPNP